ncbi:MAG: ferritin [Coprobacter sp.]|nr:ferritin [Coprobacter sp.]
MAKESVDILKGKIDVKKVIEQLNAALSEEWLAFYQYWAGALIIEGPMRTEVQREMEEHAQEEYNHAKWLADRIVELEGVPVLSPQQWFDLAHCKYLVPDDFGVMEILKQNIASERCAINRYSDIANFTDGLDFTTCDIAKRIMAEEEEHEQDLQDFVSDIERAFKYYCSCKTDK